MRLAFELAFFGVACWGLSHAGATVLGVILAVAVAVHYAASFQRVRWLVLQST